MDSKKLSYFLAVAEDLSFSRAARRMGVGQPALSRAIKDLEAELGAELFSREGGSVTLTSAGEVFLPKADEALLSLEEGLEEIRQVRADAGERLDLGYLPSSYNTFVGDVVNVFCQAFPEVNLTLHPLDAGPMVDWLRNGKVDIAFIGHICPEIEREFDLFHLWNIPVQAVVAEHHPLADASEIDLKELAGHSLISLSAEAYPGRHEFIMGILRDAGVRPTSVTRVESLLSALSNIAVGDSFSLMPSEVSDIASSHVRFIPLSSPQAHVKFHALVQKGESRKLVLTLLNESRRTLASKKP
ncbi:MAG: LysR family transcriptional regulator [Verrucomicrobiota bacterium]